MRFPINLADWKKETGILDGERARKAMLRHRRDTELEKVVLDMEANLNELDAKHEFETTEIRNKASDTIQGIYERYEGLLESGAEVAEPEPEREVPAPEPEPPTIERIYLPDADTEQCQKAIQEGGTTGYDKDTAPHHSILGWKPGARGWYKAHGITWSQVWIRALSIDINTGTVVLWAEKKVDRYKLRQIPGLENVTLKFDAKRTKNGRLARGGKLHALSGKVSAKRAKEVVGL